MNAPVVTAASTEAEQALLGLVLMDADTLDVAGAVRHEHFGEPLHSRMWATMTELRKGGQRTDPAALWDRMKADPALQALGGVRYLFDLLNRSPALPTAERYAESVVDHASRRELAHVGRWLSEQQDSGATSEETLAEAETQLARIAREGGRKALAEPVGLNALDTLERAWSGELRGHPVGVECLDRVTNGVRPGDVWIVGGRSSMGKSVVALSVARGIAEQGRGVLVFSLEMPLREVQCRLVSDIAHDRERMYDPAGNIGYGDLLKGRGAPHLRDEARRAAKKLASLPLSVVDAGGLTIMDIRSQAQRQIRAWERMGVEPGAVVIDHLGLVRSHGPARDSKAAETADTVNELKSIAKALRTPLICLAQVNRGPEGRNDKRPTMADLNWSGSIEQIADFVCLLYREAYYLQRSPGEEAEAAAIACEHDLELIVAKNRSGPICTVKAWVDVACNALRDREDHASARVWG